jgi:chromosome segregation ATPase
MSSVAFDTHAAANRFKRAGFTEDQVEALVDVARATTALPDVSTLATKSDVSRVEGAVERLRTDMDGLKGDVEGLKADVVVLKADVEDLKADVKVLKFDVAGLKIDVAGLKTDVGGLKTDVARLGNNMNRLEQVLKADIARSEAKLEARISSTQVQSLTIMIAAMALTTTLGTALARLIR